MSGAARLARGIAVLPLCWACAASTVPPHPTALAPPEEWTEPAPPDAGDVAAAPGSPTAAIWWSQFGSPQLDALVSEALRANYDLAVAGARVAIAEAQARVAGADRLPGASVALEGVRAQRNFIGFPIPGAEDFVLSTTSTNLGLGVDVQWEADLWGRLRAGERAAVAEVEASEADRLGAELSVTGAVVQGWLALIEARQQIDLAAQTLESRRRSRERVDARYRRGLTGSLDVRLARNAEALAASAHEDLERLHVDTARQLELLLGRYPGAALAGPAELPSRLPPVPPALPADVLTRRPDLAAAERRLAAAGARVDEARRALYPRLSLTGSAGTASAELRDLLDGDFSVWSAAAGLLQPLFQGGRLRAAVDFERASRESLLAEYARRTLQAFAEVESALAAERHLEAQVQALETAAAEAAAAEELAFERYGSGLESYLAVLEAQRQSVVSASQLLGRRRERLAARVDLILALGGDFGDETRARDAVASTGSAMESSR